MRRIVRKIRTKPREARQRLLFGITFATFFALIGLWIIILDARARQATAVKEVKEGESPFSILGDGIKEAVDTVKK